MASAIGASPMRPELNDVDMRRQRRGKYRRLPILQAIGRKFMMSIQATNTKY